MPSMAQEPTVYSHGHHESVLRSHQWRTAENSAAYLLDRLRPGLTLLDVGSGPGTLTCDLAERVQPGRVLGVDPSADVTTQATDELARRVGAGRLSEGQVTFRTDNFMSDAVAAAGPFDVVHAHQVLQHLADPVEALRHMAALARPEGGVLAARDADYGNMRWSPKSPELDRWRVVIREVTRRNGGDADAGRRMDDWAAAAGLANATVTHSTWTFDTPEDRAWWGGLWAERCRSSSLNEHAQRYGLASAAELEALAAGWQAWAEQPDAWFTVPHGEILCLV